MFIIGTIITIMQLLIAISEFTGKASAKDGFESLSACLSGISESKLLQVSSDGPNVNLPFLNLLEEDRNEKELSQLVETCGLHTLHNSMKHGEKASGWNVKELLHSSYESGKAGKTIYFENKPGKLGKVLIFWNLYAFFRMFLEF